MKRNQQQGFPIIPGMGFPGQRERRDSNEKTDFHLPLRQWAGVIVLLTLSFLLAVANVLIIGPIVGYITGIITIIVLLLYGYSAVYEQGTPVTTLVAVVGLSLLGFWTLSGYTITDRFWWDIRCTWEPRNKLLFVVFSGLFLTATSLPIYRFAQEVVDPNWSPTITIRPAGWGVLWPWTKPTSDVEPEVIIEQVEVVKEVPRPVPSLGAQSVTPEQSLDAERTQRAIDKTVIAPSGNQVKVQDLVTFIRQAPIHGTAYTSVWAKRDWELEQWQDVIDVWAMYGVVTKREEKKSTRVLVKDFTRAMELLSSAFD